MATIDGIIGIPDKGHDLERISTQTASGRSQSDTQTATLWIDRLMLAATLALSAFLQFFRIEREGTGNAYYAAAVKSMLDNLHAFFFVSFDNAGFVSVDKPPLGLWLQTASAKIFGFHGWSIMLPQMLATVGSVFLLWVIVRRSFGPVAALIAALALAISPISVATGRNNTSDSVLTLMMLGAALAIVIAAERGTFRWVALSMILIGLGFNIKMMEAYLVLPAIGLVYLLAPHISRKRKIAHLTAGGLVLAVVSLAWPTIVELTPADQRPYVGSSTNNSVFDLIFGYNGIQRLIPGNGWTIFDFHIGGGSTAGSSFSSGGSGGASENGVASAFRLLNAQLGGQIGWLLPFAIVAFYVAWGPVRSLAMNPQRLQLVLWGVWSATQIAFFSVANHFHRYYMTTLAPAIMALVGIGAVALWKLYRGGGWRSLLLPATIALTAVSQMRILENYTEWSERIGPAIVGLALLSVLGLLIGLMAQVYRQRQLPRLGLIAATAGMAALLVAPATWSGYTAANGVTSSSQPAAGPSASTSGRDGMPSGGTSVNRGSAGFPGSGGEATSDTTDQALIDYLRANKGDASWIVAVQSAQQGSSLILESGEAVMAIGGFKGSDPILSVESFAQLVTGGKVRFVLASGGGGGFSGSMPQPSSRSEDGSGGQGRPGDSGSGSGGMSNPPSSTQSSAGDQPSSTGTSNDNGPQSSAAQTSGNSTSDSGGSASIMQWVAQNCSPVSISGSSATVYDCQGAAA